MTPAVRRRVLTPLVLIVAALLALAGLTTVTASPADAATGPIVLNEIEADDPSGGTDWIELTNTGATAIDISGYKLKDDTTAHPFAVVPSGITLAAHGFYTIDVADPPTFGLGKGGDTVNLYRPDGTTLLDQFTWTANVTGTYSRCPDGTGAFIDAPATKGAGNQCAAVLNTVKLNEVQQNGAADWVELRNGGTATADVSGYVIRDNVDSHGLTIAPGTTIAPGGFYTADVSAAFSLDAADSARLFAPGGTTALDSYSWLSDTGTTYGRCPDGATFTKTTGPTRDAANACRVGATWPGGAAVATVDPVDTFTSNLSGLDYEASGTAEPGRLWGVVNGGPAKLYRLVRNGSTWAPDSGDWSAGKVLKYTDGTGEPDAEGVTFTDAGPSAGVFVSTERDNSNGGVSRPAILEFAPDAPGTTLTATHDWNLTPDLPGLGPNLGLEAITWVPDSYLTSRGLGDQHTGTAYSPTTYPDHGNGLFLVGVENTGNVYAYALDLTSNSFQQVAHFDSGFPSVMDLNFEAETQTLWVECDDTCHGQSARFGVDTAGAFAASTYEERPSGMADLNNEGFATTPQAECVNGVKPVFWADDSDDAGHSLRQGSLACTPLAPGITASLAASVPPSATGWYRVQPTVTFTCTTRLYPLVDGCPSPVTLGPAGADLSVNRTVTAANGGSATASVSGIKVDLAGPQVRIRGGRGPARHPRCVASDSLSGLAGCTLVRHRHRHHGHLVVTLTATATDRADNVTVRHLTYRARHHHRHHHRHHRG